MTGRTGKRSDDDLREALLQLDLDDLSPVEALTKLYEWRQKLLNEN